MFTPPPPPPTPMSIKKKKIKLRNGDHRAVVHTSPYVNLALATGYLGDNDQLAVLMCGAVHCKNVELQYCRKQVKYIMTRKYSSIFRCYTLSNYCIYIVLYIVVFICMLIHGIIIIYNSFVIFIILYII